MGLEIEDINAHLTRLEGQRMLSTLKHFEVSVPEISSIEQPHADQVHAASAATSVAIAGTAAAVSPVGASEDARKEQ